MEDNKDNANPTILNPADLPTRRRRSSQSDETSSKPGSLFDCLKPAHDEGYQSGGGDDHDNDDNQTTDPIDRQEIYDLISTISDPEHPLSLGSLAVVNLADIDVSPPTTPGSRISTVTVLITPTITHCSLATVIGLGVRVRLEQSLPPRFRVDVRIKEGTHSTADAVNKQLADKERVCAALDNSTLMGVVRKMLSTCL